MAALAASADGPSAHVASPLSSGSVAYVYDGAGNIIHIGTDRYLYDSVSRLKSATVNGAANKQTFSYDAFGNRIGADRIPGAVSCLSQAACESSPTISKTTNRITSGGALYDAAGNLLTLGSYAYTYDLTNTLTSSSDGSTTREFIYTAADERLAIDSHPANNTAAATWTWTIRDLEQNVLREFTSSGTSGSTSGSWTKDYVWRNGLLLATETPNSARLHFHLDHLGTPRFVTNQSGVTAGQHDYYPFGTEMASSVQESPQEAIKFAGQEWDAGDINALTYMHARSYGAAMGRFLSVDPEFAKDTPRDPQKWNRYAYVTNNPLRYTDPTGEDGWDAVNGFFNAIVNDAGLTIRQSGNSDFETGQLNGDRAGVVGGFILTTVFTGDAIVTSPSGVGALAFGTAAVASGAFTLNAAHHLSQDNNPQSSGGSEPNKSSYENTTKGRSVQNRSTNVKPDDFGKNLEKSGFTKSVSKDGKVTIYTRDDTTYTLRGSSKSTGGPTADVLKNGELILKIRFAQ